MAEGGNPFAAFDLGGALTVRAVRVHRIPHLPQDIPITGKQTLYSFEDESARNPVLATKSGDTLFLNMGPNSIDRLNGDTSDGHEEFELKHLGGGEVTVWSTKLGVSEGSQKFTGITHIVGLGGQGNDSILLHEFDGSGITAELDGDVGDDHIEYVGSTESHSVKGARVLAGWATTSSPAVTPTTSSMAARATTSSRAAAPTTSCSATTAAWPIRSIRPLSRAALPVRTATTRSKAARTRRHFRRRRRR